MCPKTTKIVASNISSNRHIYLNQFEAVNNLFQAVKCDINTYFKMFSQNSQLSFHSFQFLK